MEASAASAAGARAVPSLGAARRRWGEALIKALLILAALISVLTTTGIVIALLRETIDFFGEVGVWEFLSGGKGTPLFEPASFGVRPLVIGTFLVTGIALLVAAPLGLGAAIYLSEYAKPRVRKTIKPILEILAGVPTIVFGYFALTFFTPTILEGALNVRTRAPREFSDAASEVDMGAAVKVYAQVRKVSELEALTRKLWEVDHWAFAVGDATLVHVALDVELRLEPKILAEPAQRPGPGHEPLRLLVGEQQLEQPEDAEEDEEPAETHARSLSGGTGTASCSCGTERASNTKSIPTHT